LSTEGFVEVNGARLFYEVAGNGRPIVLAHAGIADSRMWDDQMAAFAPEFKVVRYDLRGFGRSSIPPAEYAHHDDLLGLLRALDIPSAILVGASMGGDVVTALALEHPEAADALILVDSLVGTAERSDELRAGWKAVDAAFEAGDVERAIELELRMWVDGPARSPEAVDPAVRERVRVMDTDLFTRVTEQELASEQDVEPPGWSRLAEIRVPTLVFAGEEDQPEALASADALATGITGARKVMIPGAAHLPSMERPAEFNRIVLEFIRNL
jgi:pimeloyl-ACP methyl ester carboxylesterase